jgi:hypothetical protein
MNPRVNASRLQRRLQYRSQPFLWRKAVPGIEAVAERNDQLVILRDLSRFLNVSLIFGYRI